MKEQGKVAKVNKGETIIEMEKHDECHKCGMCALARSGKITVSGDRTRELAVGDDVEVEMEPARMLMLCFLLYGVPLIVFAGAALLLYAVTQSPLTSFFGALAFTVLTYIAVGFYMRKKSFFSPHIIKKS